MTAEPPDKGTLDASEATYLLEMPKKLKSPQVAYLDRKFTLDIESIDGKEEFIVDVGNYSITIKYKNQLRCRSNMPLLRLDVGTGWHRNPNVRISCNPTDPFFDVHDDCIGRYYEPGEPHIHFYREGFDDKWAYPIPSCFKNLDDKMGTLMEFLKKCNVDGRPTIQRGLYDD